MSQARYGGYYHDVNSVGFNSYSREFVKSPTGYNHYMRLTVELEAKIIRSTISLIMAELNLLRAAYSVGGYSFFFYDDSGNALPWGFDSSLSIGGTTILKPVSHGAILGSHGVNFLKCQVTLQADFMESFSANQYLTFTESIQFSGSGRPLKVKRLPATGAPFKQQVTEQSWYTAVQSGSLSSTTANPSPPDPIFPDYWDGDESDYQITRPSMVTQRGSIIESGVSWSYRFSSPTELIGLPNSF